MTVEGLIGLRNRTLDDYVDGRTSADAHRADLSAIAVELDRSCQSTVRDYWRIARRASWPRSLPTAGPAIRLTRQRDCSPSILAPPSP
jgi:hypothetical protein